MSFREEITLSAKDNASNVIRGVVGNLRGLVAQVAGMAGVAGTGALFGAMVKEGLGFQKMLEDSRIAIAAVVGSLHTYSDAAGNVVKGERAWNAALADSAQIQERLRTAALTTTATYQEMVEAFEVGIGPMSRAGIALSDTAEATQRLTQVAAAASIPMAQLAVEIRQFFNGDVMRGRLLQTLQITKEQIEEHKKLGDMMDFIRQKTESYARAAQAAAETLTGRWSNLKDAIQQTLGMGMESLYEKLKEAMSGVSSQFVSFGKDDKGNLTAQFSEEVIGRVKTMAASLAAAVERFKELIPAAVEFGLALGEHIAKAIDLLSRLPLKPILEILTDLVKVTEGWGLAIGGVVYAAGGLKGIAATLGLLSSLGTSVGLVFVELQARIIAATFASTGLAAGLAGAATAGLFGALIAEIGLLVYTVKLAADEARELERVAEANANTADTMLSNVARWEERFKGLVTGPTTKEQMGLQEELQKLEEWITKIKSIGGVVDEKTMEAYKRLGASVREMLPPLEQARRTANGLADGTDEARKAWQEYVQKLKDQAALSGLEGIRKKLAEIAITSKNAVADAKKKAAEVGVSAAEAVAAIATKTRNDVQTAWKGFAKDFEAEPVEIVATWDYELKKLPDHVKTYFTKAGAVAVQTVEQWRESLRVRIEDLLSGAFSWDGVATVANGMEAGWLSVLAALPTAAESAATAVQGIWAGMARSFDDLFFNVLSGRLDNLKDVFKNLWESLLQTFSRYLSDMLQRWIATQVQMEGTAAAGSYPGINGGGGGGVAGVAGGGWGKALGYLGAGATGYGLGGMIGPGGAGNQWGGAVGAVGGLAVGSMAGVISGVGSALGLGAAAGSVVPIIGTIVGALIGAIIGGLFNKNTERSMTGSLGGMVSATKWEWIQPRAKKPRGGPWGGDEGEPGEPLPGFWEGFLERPTTAFERQGEKVFQAQAATLADIFRTGSKDQAGELLAAYQNALKESLSGAWFKIAAGSQEDIEKDAEILLTRLIPRIGLSAAFGQTGYLPHGDRDATGGIPGINWGMPGMDEAGNWTGAKQLFDPEAPIPKMLAGLGFTADAIGALASRISTDDPQKLLQYIQGVVGVVVGIRDLSAEMGKSFAQLAADWSEEAAAGPVAGFAKSAEELAGMWNALSLYSGDDQIAKAQQAQAASDQFWQSVVQYLRQVQAATEKMSASIQAQRVSMRDFLSPETEGARVDRLMGEIDGVWGKLAKAVDPAEVEKIVGEAQASIDAVFRVMAERVTRGKALLERLGALDSSLASMGLDVFNAQREQSNPLAVWADQIEEIQGRVTEAASLSGLAQIDAIEGVAEAGEEMAGKLKSLLSEIASTSDSINKSIDSQIWELGVGELDATGQAGAITQRIKELQDQLAIATSPAQIAALTSEIQSLTGRYLGQFGENDPERAGAVAWAKEQLERTRGLANEALEEMRRQAEEQAKALQEILKGAATDIAGNVSEASGVIGQLSHTLGELDRVMKEKMGALGQGILDSLEPLRVAMQGASDIFTGATQTTANALTAPEAGLATSATRASGALDSFEGAVRRAASALGLISDGRATATEPPIPITPAPATVDARAVVPLMRRYAYAVTPRTY